MRVTLLCETADDSGEARLSPNVVEVASQVVVRNPFAP